MMLKSVDLFTAFYQSVDMETLPKRICVGLSGGVDSVVLLHLLCRLREQMAFDLSAVHVHHGLNLAADDWLKFCERLCLDLEVPFIAERVKINSKGLGIEAAARQERYQVFYRQSVEVLALAHHADDQVETFLLAALRGGGLRALASMPIWREIGHHQIFDMTQVRYLWRPLLLFSRIEIEYYAKQEGLSWIEDSSNFDEQFLRNWLRHQVIPAFKQKLPCFQNQMRATILALQDDLAILDEVLLEDEQAIYIDEQFQVALWQTLSLSRRKQQLWQFAQKYGLGVPSKHSINEFEQVLQSALTAEWRLPKGRAILFRGVLLALPDDLFSRCIWLTQLLSGSLKNLLTQVGCEYLVSSLMPEMMISIRAANKQDTLHLKIGRKSVWKLLQEYGVPSAVRPLWPVLVNSSGECMVVFNIRCHQDWQFVPRIEWLEQYRVHNQSAV